LISLLLAGLFLTRGEANASSASAPSDTTGHKRVAANYGKIPLSFEPNKGQTDPRVQFLSRGSGYSLFLTRDEVVLNLERQSARASSAPTAQKFGPALVDMLRMKLVGASQNSAISGLEPQPAVVNYLIGNEPEKWHSGIPTFGKVNFAQVYPGVDLVFYGNQRQLEYDFVVGPGADPSRIVWQIKGAKPIVDAAGNLVLNAANGPAGFKKPVVYQMDGDKKIAVAGAFTVAHNRIGFKLGSYNRSKPLIIDPVLSYATYLGGSATDSPQGIAYDSQGSAYVVGSTASSNFPVQNPYQPNPYGTKIQINGGAGYSPTAFVTKFSPDGSSLVYSTYLGGSSSNSGFDSGTAIAVDSAGEAFVVGATASPDFPITPAAFQTICSPDGVDGNGSPMTTPKTSCGLNRNDSAFVTKLNAAGSGLIYSTFLGGHGQQWASAIAIDSAGRAYVGGGTNGQDCQTYSTAYTISPVSCFPTTSGALVSGQEPMNADQPGFIAVFDPTGSNLLYSSLFSAINPACSWENVDSGKGGCSDTTTSVNGVAVDANGNFYIAGTTNEGLLPTTAGVIQPTTGPLGPGAMGGNQTIQSGSRGFVAKFNPVTATGGATLAYATYLGGKTAAGADAVTGIVADSEGYAYVSGSTSSADFPVTTGAYQTSPISTTAAFVAKLNPTGTAIEWATYLGGISANTSQVHSVGSVQLDAAGNVYLNGTAQYGFPVVNPVYGNKNQQPAFVSELDPTGSQLLFSTLIDAGGGNGMGPGRLAVDPKGNIYVAMSDPCAGALVTPGSFQQANKVVATGCVAGTSFNTTGYVVKMMAVGTGTITLTAAPSPAEVDQAVLLTATVTPTATYASVPSGTVQFEDGTVALGAAVALDGTGKAVYKDITLTPGTHSLVAVYSGDSTYPTMTATQTLVVGGQAAPVDGGTDTVTGVDAQAEVEGVGDAPVASTDTKIVGIDASRVSIGDAFKVVDATPEGGDATPSGAGGSGGGVTLPGNADAGSPIHSSSGCSMSPARGGNGAVAGLVSLLLMALSIRRRRR
jgi:hypothetical protein